jgi:hypothetical protein
MRRGSIAVPTGIGPTERGIVLYTTTTRRRFGTNSLRSILLLEGEIGDGTMDDGKNSAAVALGRMGG